jgi:predicted extracellular nuclease
MRQYLPWSTGDFALANDGDELLLLDDQDRILDKVSYGDKTTFLDPAIGSVYEGQSIERVPASCDTDNAADWQPTRFPTPGKINLTGECLVSLAPDINDRRFLSIGQIQGTGDISPYIHQRVNFRGLVTGKLTDRNSAGTIFHTLFLQDIPGHEDGAPQTSDAIAVFQGRRAPPYEIGDLLQVSGVVTEFYGLTEIDDRDLEIIFESSNHLLPEKNLLVIPQDRAGQKQYLESKESMLVSLAEPATIVGPTHSGCGFALLDAFTSPAPLPRLKAEEQTYQPMLVINHSDVACHDLPALKNGDLVSAVSGPLTYHFDQYKIVLQNPASLKLSPIAWPTLPLPLKSVSDQFTIATFNLNNHFDGTKDDPDSAEPVVTLADLTQKQEKLAFTLGKILNCPTIVALQEIENEQLLQSLAVATASYCGFIYEIAHQASSDSRGLDLAFLTDPDRVQLGAVTAYQGCTFLETGITDPDAGCDGRESPLFGRPPLRVDLLVDGQPYTLINNHFKSKREGEKETTNRRQQQAAHIANLTQALLAKNPQTALIVLGDFNDFEQSPTMQQMTIGTGLVNALATLPRSDRYTYIFDGVPQLIDGILVSDAVRATIEAVQILHVNADYPFALSVDTSAKYIGYHSSDHDLPLLLLNLPQDDRPVAPPTEIGLKPTALSNLTRAPVPTANTSRSMPTTQNKFPFWPAAFVILAAAAPVLVLLFIWRKR